MAKQAARNSGLYSSSNGQLMNTERDRTELFPPYELMGVIRDRRLHGPFDLIARKPRATADGLEGDAAIGRT